MAEPEKKCHFCHLPKERIWVETENAVAFLDGFPVTEGHTLIIPKRHIMILHDLPQTELNEVWGLVAKMRNLLVELLGPRSLDHL